MATLPAVSVLSEVETEHDTKDNVRIIVQFSNHKFTNDFLNLLNNSNSKIYRSFFKMAETRLKIFNSVDEVR